MRSLGTGSMLAAENYTVLFLGRHFLFTCWDTS